MNKLILRYALRLFVMGGVLGGVMAWAQLPDASGGVNSAMIKLFGDTLAFSANAQIQVLNSNRVEWLRMPGAFNMTDTKLRVDVDMGSIQSRNVAPATINTFKQMGMDRVASVIRPDKKAIYIIYPHAQSYVSMALSNEDAQIASQKVEKSLLGRETIDGHPCVKNRSVVKNSKGVKLIEATTWNATDLQNFPIQIETKENGNISVMHFQQVVFNKPDPRLFEAPAGYKQYSNPQDLLTAAYKKASGGQKAPATQPPPAAQKPSTTQKPSAVQKK